MSTNPELEAELSSNMDELREAGVGSEAERLAEILENPDAALPAGDAPVEISDSAQRRTDEVLAPADERFGLTSQVRRAAPARRRR